MGYVANNSNYNSENKKEFLGMHNLSGCFVQESGDKTTFKYNDKEFIEYPVCFKYKFNK